MPRLRRSDLTAPGFRRVRAGRGFAYRTPEGDLLTDPDLRARFESLTVPPAWVEVWFCPYPHGHIQATGIDAAGRRQYLYHPAWRRRMDRIKFDRALALAEVLPNARGRVTIDLRRDDVSRERALAAAFRMLDSANLRVGSEQYALAHGSFGLSTLLAAHASVSGGEQVALRFPAKSGQEWSSDVRDPDLAAFVSRLKRRGGRARLLAWQDDRGWHPLRADEINAYVRMRTGDEFTAKDFRTLHGTVAAALSLARTGPQPTTAKKARAVAAAMRAAAQELGNTPAVARASYVDPRVVDHFDQGRTIDPARSKSAESELLGLLRSP